MPERNAPCSGLRRMDWLIAIFGEKDHITLAQECARAILIFIYGLALVRIAGRRIFGKWGALDIVVSIVIGSNLSRTLTGGAPLAGTLAATTLLVFIHWLVAHLSARVRLVSLIAEGGAVPLLKKGGLDRGQRLWHSISPADLDEALRQSGIEHIDEAQRITLEPSGKITIIKQKA